MSYLSCRGELRVFPPFFFLSPVYLSFFLSRGVPHSPHILSPAHYPPPGSSVLSFVALPALFLPPKRHFDPPAGLTMRLSFFPYEPFH